MNHTTTIITVCYNAEKTLARTMESVLLQSHPVDKYIVIDGGSTDKTVEIIRSYEDRFNDRLEWVSERDNGIYDAMNKGLQRAHGDIIGILNADDWYENDAVAHILEKAEGYPPGVYYGIMRKWQDGQEYSVVREHHNFLWRDMIPHPTTFIHRDIYQEFGFFDETYKLAADYELMLRLARRNVPFYPVNFIITNFSIGGASVRRARKMWIETINIRRKYGSLSCLQYAVFRVLIEARTFIEHFLLKERL